MSTRLLSVLTALALPLALPLAAAWITAPPVPSAPGLQDAESAPLPALRSGEYTVDPVHSSVVFGIQHLGVATFYGRFNTLSGRFRVDLEEPANSEVHVEVDAASVDTNHPGRDEHVRSADLLDVEAYPLIVFDGGEVTRHEDGRWTVAGQLDFHGESRPVEATVTLGGFAETRMGPRGGVEARLTIERSAFGMTGLMGGLGDEVSLIISLEGVLQED